MFTNAATIIPEASIFTSRRELTLRAMERRVHFPIFLQNPTQRSRNAIQASVGGARHTFREPQDAAGVYQEALRAAGIRTIVCQDTISGQKYIRPAVLGAAPLTRKAALGSSAEAALRAVR
jgi:hypothetical protein